MIRICIFDLDGTLARTQESIARPVNMTLRHFGLPEQPVSAFNYFAGDGLGNTLKRALAASGDTEQRFYDEGIVLCRQWMDEDPMYHVEPYPHVIESLQALKARGLRLAVFTNKPHASAVNVVRTLFGPELIDCVQGQTDRLPIKPDPSGLFEILERYGMDRGECLYFGDTSTDMKTGRNAGVRTVGVTWGFRLREELEQNGADVLIDSAKQIPELV